MTVKFERFISSEEIIKKEKEKVRSGFKKTFEYSKKLIRNDLNTEARKVFNVKSRNFKNIFRFKMHDKDLDKDHIGVTISVNSPYFGIFEDNNKTIKAKNSKMLIIPLLNPNYKKVKNSKEEFLNRIKIAKSLKLTFTKKIDGEVFLFIKGDTRINKLFTNYRTNFKRKVLNNQKLGSNDVFTIAILRRQITIKKHFAFTKIAYNSFSKHIIQSINKFITEKENIYIK